MYLYFRYKHIKDQSSSKLDFMMIDFSISDSNVKASTYSNDVPDDCKEFEMVFGKQTNKSW